MTVDMLKTLENLKGTWMMGGSAAEKVPPAWREIIQQDPSPDLAIIALTGQLLQFAVRPVPVGSLRLRPQIPRLQLPTPPEPARQQIRQLVRLAKFSDAQMNGLVHLLACRGYAIHPLDYLPRNVSQLPDLYTPWETWDQTDPSNSSTNEKVNITAENWDEWLPADRRNSLTSLRRQQPSIARELILLKAPSLAAEERLRVLELLSAGLSVEDRKTLEEFINDRSAKVRLLVQQFMARIGVVQDDPADLEEYASFFSATKKLLKRNWKVTANALKTDAQKKRRSELAAKLSLQGFVQALKLPDEAELIAGWECSDPQATEEFVRMVAATGSERGAALLSSRLPEFDGLSVEAIELLFARLGKTSRRELLPRVLENDSARFTATLTCCEGMLGEITWEQLKPAKALQELKKLCNEGSPIKPIEQETLRSGLYAIGLLVDQRAAAELLRLFTEKSLSASDPMLGVLKLNRCLPPGGTL